jgi:ribosome-associated toxin RatA of RatAB toxin-antitoxin module
MNPASFRSRAAAGALLAAAVSVGLGALAVAPRAHAQTPPPVPAANASVIFADGDAGAPAGDAGPAEAVQTTSEEVPGLSVRRGRSDTVIDAPFELVSRAVTDFPRYDTFMPHVRDVRVVRRNRADTDVYMQVPLRGSLGVVWALVRVNVRRTPGRLELVGHAVDGNMERFESTTVLERVPGATPRTRMMFTLLALPRLPFPSSVFSREMVSAARTVANNLRARIARDLVEGG